MLSAITLGLRALQMILAIALLGLSISLIQHSCKTFGDDSAVCLLPLVRDFDKNHAPRTVRYSIFLGICGILISAIGTVAAFIDRIPTIVPLVGDALGALFFLAGGIAWVVSVGERKLNCSDLKELPNSYWELFLLDSKVGVDWAGNFADWAREVTVSACRQAEAAHGLVWALFAFTAGLAICDYFRRRDQAKSFM